MNETKFKLNARSLALVEALIEHATERRVAVQRIDGGGRFVDCGIEAAGGLGAGLDLARICLAGLADVAIIPGEVAGRPVPVVQVVTDHPVVACLGSQYAGWALGAGKYFAMGSGPIRAAAPDREPVLTELNLRDDQPESVVGVLEGRTPPPPLIVARLAEASGVALDRVTLLGAPTASLAGGVQVVARSVETALHKLHTLGFDLHRIIAGHGSAPLPPVASDDLAAIGRTNDAILYGGRVTLYATGDDAGLAAIVARVPSNSSKDHGEPFAAIFARYHHDFYAVDPHLFSPAEVLIQNVETGRTHHAGQTSPEVVARSFFGG